MKRFNKFPLVLGLIIGILLILFLWPRFVRIHCSTQAKKLLDQRKNTTGSLYKQYLEDKNQNANHLSNEEINSTYQFCLARYGVKPESLLLK